MKKECMTPNQELVDQMLDKSEKGWPYNTIENARVILENDELFKGNIRDNLLRLFLDCVITCCLKNQITYDKL